MRLQRVVIAGIMVPPNIPQVNWKKCHADERYEGVVRSMLENLPKLMGKQHTIPGQDANLDLFDWMLKKKRNNARQWGLRQKAQGPNDL